MTSAQSSLHDLLRRELDGTHPLVLIETDDEAELRQALFDALDGAVEHRRWTAVHGLVPTLVQGDPIEGTDHPAGALSFLPRGMGARRSVTVFYDLSAHLGEPRTLRALKEAVEWARGHHGVVVLVEARGATVDQLLGKSLAAEVHRIEIPQPTDAELEEIIREAVRGAERTRRVEASVRRSTLDAMARSLRGLSRRQALRVIKAAVAEDDRLDDDDLARVMILKRNACVDLAGVLEFVQAPVSMDSVGGLGRLKAWLAERHLGSADEAAEFGLSLPRGVLLLGVQGAGKSLAAKAVATAWKVPLLRLDAGALYDKFVGESERKLRESLAQADRMAPAVLWIDEIEKGFASASSLSSDGGLSRRMFGTLLTWMQERQSATFLVATANDVSALPPELLRKGRFDEIFFIDLPGAEAREAILSIHLGRRRRAFADFDAKRLVAATEGYSGAEIEAGIESALRRAFADGKRPITTEDLIASFAASPPISVVMAERIEELRSWARERCAPAE